MRIVQSYWSKPSLKKENLNGDDRANGGWLDKKYHYLSWILSCMQFKKYYGNVHLFTDEYGAYHLKDLLQLPYTSITTKLNDMDKYPHDLWAVGKLYTYSLQEEPFIHVDDDVFIWDRLPTQVEQGKLIAQNLESSFDYYEKILLEISNHFNHIPEYMLNMMKNKNYLSCNAGIFGGNDITFFKKYTSEAFRFINENLNNFDKVNVSQLNIIYEQYLFLALAKKRGVDLSCLLPHTSAKYVGLADFDSVPQERTYLHLVGMFKRYHGVCENLEKYVMFNYPTYYERLMLFINDFKL